jgi:hypothetical protein
MKLSGGIAHPAIPNSTIGNPESLAAKDINNS